MLNECYKKLVSAHLSSMSGYRLGLYVTESVEGYPRVAGSKPVDQLAYLKPACAHLESGYKDSYDAWNAVNLLIKQYNEAVISAILHLERVTKDLMKKSYPTLSEYDDTKQTNYYNVPNLLGEFHDVLIGKIVAGKPLEFAPAVSKDAYNFRVQTGALPYLIVCSQELESDASPERLKKIFDAVKTHPDVSRSFESLRTLNSKTEYGLQQFVSMLRVLVERLDLGAPIEGKCEIGY